MNSSSVKSRNQRLADAGTYILMVILGLVFVFPIVFMFMSSLKPDEQLLRDSASLRAFLPVGDISLDNYKAMFERAPVLRFLFNSLLVTTLTVGIGLFINSLAAFAIAVLRWRGKGIVLGVIIATLIVPFETVAVPLLLIVSKLPSIGAEGLKTGWINTYHVQVLPFLAQALIIFLFVQFFKSLPYELVEAARIDGASWFQTYYRIYVPISGPVFSTAAILMIITMWNQYLWPLMTVQSEALRPVMIGLSYFFQLVDVAWGEVMAFLSFITIPVLIFFLLIQRTYIESIAASGIKG